MEAEAFQNWYQYVDEIEDISVSGGVTDADVKALRLSPNQPEISGGVVGIDAYDAIWSIDAGTISAAISPGDVITDDDGVLWSVNAVSVESIGAVPIKYNCTSRQQVT